VPCLLKGFLPLLTVVTIVGLEGSPRKRGGLLARRPAAALLARALRLPPPPPLLLLLQSLTRVRSLSGVLALPARRPSRLHPLPTPPLAKGRPPLGTKHHLRRP